MLIHIEKTVKQLVITAIKKEYVDLTVIYRALNIENLEVLKMMNSSNAS